MKKIYIILTLLFAIVASSCMTPFKGSATRNPSPRPNKEPIPFEQIDKNKDGNISKEEAEEYDSSVVGTDISTPAYITVGILLSSVVGCLLLIRKKKKE